MNEMILSLKKNIGKPEAFAIKRAVGTDFSECDISTYISILKLIPEGTKTTDSNLNAAYITAKTMYTMERDPYYTGSYVRFEEALGRLYRSESIGTDSMKRKIEHLIDSDIGEAGIFAASFFSLLARVKRDALKSEEHVDYESLYKDLTVWNYEPKVRERWARSIVIPKKERTGDESEK